MEADDLVPIQLNITALTGECHRVSVLAEQLEAAGADVASLRVDNWTGAAGDRFELVRHALVANLRRAADAHQAAAEALAGYVGAGEELRRLADSVIAEARASADPIRREAARLSLDRWRRQLATAAEVAARAIRVAGEELAEIRRVVPEAVVTPPVAEPPAGQALVALGPPDEPALPRPRPQPVVERIAPVERVPEQPAGQPDLVWLAELPGPYGAVADPELDLRRLRVLNNAVLDAWQGWTAAPGDAPGGTAGTGRGDVLGRLSGVSPYRG
ncbi:hypothetical protein [Goodfellowiella coeruleoviolacea]|uniref:Uncharacterized protein n=1 Tax=Goodfellowiella coeruleoviolacea TaxID=334858 RepID=A0AAE3KDW3_9PSEU|nr:hypothetical protein [Goodfellowiella coeruleoviolacea]MCP2164586.1 hypothetical protein [Goodfellowiella coeruleoviolacea]